MRYDGMQVTIDPNNKRRYFKALKYPDIPIVENDIFIISVFGDRLDVLSYQYFGNTDDYWILVVANGLPGDSIYLQPGTQLRIPSDTVSIKQSFNELNNKV